MKYAGESIGVWGLNNFTWHGCLRLCFSGSVFWFSSLIVVWMNV